MARVVSDVGLVLPVSFAAWPVVGPGAASSGRVSYAADRFRSGPGVLQQPHLLGPRGPCPLLAPAASPPGREQGQELEGGLHVAGAVGTSLVWPGAQVNLGAPRRGCWDSCCVVVPADPLRLEAPLPGTPPRDTHLSWQAAQDFVLFHVLDLGAPSVTRHSPYMEIFSMLLQLMESFSSWESRQG